jgi:hypothetical protein
VDDESFIERAVRAPVEYCLSLLRVVMRQPLERYGKVMFNRGVQYERERRRLESLPPKPISTSIIATAVTVDPDEYDPDRTPVRPPLSVASVEVVVPQSEDERDD